MTIRSILLASVALATLALPAGSWAQTVGPIWNQPHFQGPDAQRGTSILSVSDIIERVRERYRVGDVVGSPRLEDRGGRLFYIVRWRHPNGLVVDVRVDAQSGRVLGAAG